MSYSAKSCDFIYYFHYLYAYKVHLLPCYTGTKKADNLHAAKEWLNRKSVS